MFTIRRLIVENFRILFPLMCMSGLFYVGETCLETCRMMGYDPMMLLSML